jgi:hypothetical protein
MLYENKKQLMELNSQASSWTHVGKDNKPDLGQGCRVPWSGQSKQAFVVFGWAVLLCSVHAILKGKDRSGIRTFISSFLLSSDQLLIVFTILTPHIRCAP